MPIITGSNGNDNLFGTADADTINALDGDDTIDGGLGDDVIDGGAGSDTVSYLSASGSVNIGFNSAGTNGFGDGAAGSDVLLNIENAVGSNFADSISGSSLDNILDGAGGDDLILGRFGNDILFGGSGQDTLYGQEGNDQIFGGEGNDFMRGGSGDDLINGGNGFDRVSFFPTGTDVVTGGVTVSLMLQGFAQNTGQGFDTLIGVESLSGTPFNDSLTGDNNVNWLIASDFDGAGGDDQLYGLGGNDLLEVASGNHVVDGGADNDTLSFNGLGYTGGAVTVSLALGGAQVTGLGTMTISNVENLSGTSFGDTLTGDANANILYGAGGSDTLNGGAGDDTLYGDAIVSAYNPVDGNPSGPAVYTDVTLFEQVAGDDILDGGAGNDIIDGGAGNDTASFASWTEGVFAGLNNSGNGFANNELGTEFDTLISIENLTGSAFDDSLNGNNGDNVLDGAGGDDVISGRLGNDTLLGGDGQDLLYGQEGNDQIFGGEGNDFMRGGSGDDVINGGNGFDRVSFFPTGTDVVTGGVTVSLMLQGVAQNTGQGFDTLIGVESLSGTAFNDSLTGDNGVNWLVSADFDGAGGDDQLYGLGGYDIIEVGAGNHIIDGGADVDVLSFNALGFALPNGVTVSLALQGAAQDTGLGAMFITNIEYLSGTSLGDTLSGDGGANEIYGAGGSDVLRGGSGDDVLYGDGMISVYDPSGSPTGPAFYADSAVFDHTAGDNVLEGGEGDDVMFGGGGIDTASYANASGSVSVTLFPTNGVSSGADGNDVMYDVENVTGSAFNDTILANALDNVLIGGGGNDFMRGRAGNDVLIGGAGDDYLDGGAGNDTIDGGSGFDRVSYAVGATVGVTVNLNLQGSTQNTGGGGFDLLTGIEHVSGTIFNDVITGDGGANWLWGGSNGTGPTGNDTIDAGGGNDLVMVGTGTHTLIGGTGIDTLSLWGNSTDITATGVTFSLALQGAAQNTEQGMMNVSGFENVSGSSYDDFITGNASANILLGDIGNDTINGGDGNDILYGDGRMIVDLHGSNASGPITLFGDVERDFGPDSGVDGNDTLDGGKGDDFLYGGRGDDVLTGAQGSDVFVIEALSGDDRITDFKNSDTILFDAASGVDSYSDLTFTQVGKDTLITWGTTDSLLVEGVKPNKMGASDFDFGAPAAVASRAVMEAPDLGPSSHDTSAYNSATSDYGLIIG